MKKNRKSILSAVMLLVLCMAMALPVSAAKPKKNICGLLAIANSEEDIQYYTAVCVEEEDGNYIYCGSHPIQQQAGLYASLTTSGAMNSIYELEEDTTYDEIKGVYRFELGEVLQNGSEADLFPQMGATGKNETVYFVHLDTAQGNSLVTEKSTVVSIKEGVLTTKDALEKDSETGDFSIILNDSGEVVGFCKSGLATVTCSEDTGLSSTVILLCGVAALAAVGVGIGAGMAKRRKPPIDPPDDRIPQPPAPPWNDTVTILDDETQLETSLVLICHGGILDGRIYPIGQEGVTIGREPDNSIRYPGQTPGISRHHIRLYWQNGQLMLMDLNSKNGTFVNQEGRIGPMHPIPMDTGDFFYLAGKQNGFEIACK